jgi:hypothetical protein
MSGCIKPTQVGGEGGSDLNALWFGCSQTGIELGIAVCAFGLCMRIVAPQILTLLA